MGIADRVRILARQEMHRRHVVQHRDLPVEHGDVDFLAPAALLAFVKRSEHPHHAEHAPAEIADRNTRAYRIAAVRARDRHAAAGRLGHLIEGRAPVARPARAESRDGACDDARVDGGERPVIDPEPLRHAGREVADDDVRHADQPVEERPAAPVFEVDRDAFLVAVERQEVGTHAVERMFRIRGEQAPGPLPRQRFDLDGLRAQIGQDHAGIGAGQHVGEIEDSNAFQCACHARRLRRYPIRCRKRASAIAWRLKRLGRHCAVMEFILAPGSSGGLSWLAPIPDATRGTPAPRCLARRRL